VTFLVPVAKSREGGSRRKNNKLIEIPFMVGYFPEGRREGGGAGEGGNYLEPPT
jgi:hypothetical protein